jgi:hypothetical protein
MDPAVSVQSRASLHEIDPLAPADATHVAASLHATDAPAPASTVQSWLSSHATWQAPAQVALHALDVSHATLAPESGAPALHSKEQSEPPVQEHPAPLHAPASATDMHGPASAGGRATSKVRLSLAPASTDPASGEEEHTLGSTWVPLESQR